MRIRADFSERAVVRPEDYEWLHSPANGVDRVMLDRIGDEVARATTIVHFAPDSHFDVQTHGGGEEVYVLEGVFSDETGDFPAGSYVRNPIGTSHAPHTNGGCTIFVKLHQFDDDDREQMHIDTGNAVFAPGPSKGLTILRLHQTPRETVSLMRLEPGAKVARHNHEGGGEILVLDGTLEDEHGLYPKGTWLRNPTGSDHEPSSPDGCLSYIKTGHLAGLG